MKKRKYIVRNIEDEGDPIVTQGESPFYINDKDLVPRGFVFNWVENSPALKTIYVNEEEV